ncbi:gamma-glutamylcyclotransferase family protein [Streptomyces aureoverticillatus]|uniref:gamma-glutamylcyclotransferase family protein n=1 Tax=Streptomyces aureoverticillatus TaxID=66871 RepID=UPI0013D9D2EB|nr:gamma-glutamylcyclotransferase family protein [Streptomyces aureoverticillatus]QIB47756.1 gamma-glutamylcyclotransferase [Streptomyces aureoverticillatus]
MTLSAHHSLFTYGTLQMCEVQLARFGRLLPGRRDALPGYRTTEIWITDPDVIAISGTDRHLLVVPSDDPADAVEGAVLELTDEELAAADDYEVDDYARVEVTLVSGAKAWAYLESARNAV